MNPTKIGNYNSISEFIYRNGQPFKLNSFPKNLQRGKMRGCFKNAALLALSSPKYFYVEGYAFNIIPVLHAWCVDKNKNVIDPTWTDGKEYFGIVIKKSYLEKSLLSRKIYGLIDNPEQEWPLLKLDRKIWKGAKQ